MPWLPEGEPISNTTLVAYVLKKTPSQMDLAAAAGAKEGENGAKVGAEEGDADEGHGSRAAEPSFCCSWVLFSAGRPMPVHRPSSLT